MFNVAATAAAVAHATAATARSIPMEDRAKVLETLRKEGVVLADGRDGYEILLTKATRWVWETSEDGSLVPAWGAGTRGYAKDIFAVLDNKETLAEQEARWAALREAQENSSKAWYGRGLNPGLCAGCEEAGQILPGHFLCTFGA
jgi:hypothetical protein